MCHNAGATSRSFKRGASITFQFNKTEDPLQCLSQAEALCCRVQGRGFDLGCGGHFCDGGERRKHPCVDILVHIKDPRVVKINPESSTMACLITRV